MGFREEMPPPLLEPPVPSSRYYHKLQLGHPHNVSSLAFMRHSLSFPPRSPVENLLEQIIIKPRLRNSDLNSNSRLNILASLQFVEK